MGEPIQPDELKRDLMESNSKRTGSMEFTGTSTRCSVSLSSNASVGFASFGSVNQSAALFFSKALGTHLFLATLGSNFVGAVSRDSIYRYMAGSQEESQ